MDKTGWNNLFSQNTISLNERYERLDRMEKTFWFVVMVGCWSIYNNSSGGLTFPLIIALLLDCLTVWLGLDLLIKKTD